MKRIQDSGKIYNQEFKHTNREMMIEEMTKSAELLERRKAVVANGVGVFNTATVSHAKGAIITDVDGKERVHLENPEHFRGRESVH